MAYGFSGGETALEFLHDDVSDVVFFFLEGTRRRSFGLGFNLFVDCCGNVSKSCFRQPKADLKILAGILI